MTKQGFVEFSFETEYAIDLLLDLLNWHSKEWIFHWEYLKDIITKNNITVSYIVNVLRGFKNIDTKITIDKFEFFKFMCEMANCGYDENHVVSQYLHCL